MKKYIVQQKFKKPHTGGWNGRTTYGKTNITAYAKNVKEAKKKGCIGKNYKITAVFQEVWKSKRKR